MLAVTTYLRARESGNISNRDIEILQAASVMGMYVDQFWITKATSFSMEQISSLCMQIGSQHGYLFTFAPQSLQLKHKKYQSHSAINYIENVFAWQSILGQKLFQEAFTLKYTQNLMYCGLYLLSRYRLQYSFIEKFEDRFQFYLPSITEDMREQFDETLIDDITQEYGLKKEQVNEQSSLLKLVHRRTSPHLVKNLEQFKTCNLTDETFVYEFDGLFVPLELLLRCLNPCAELANDIFDEIELMQLNKMLLQNVRFYGSIP